VGRGLLGPRVDPLLPARETRAAAPFRPVRSAELPDAAGLAAPVQRSSLSPRPTPPNKAKGGRSGQVRTRGPGPPPALPPCGPSPPPSPRAASGPSQSQPGGPGRGRRRGAVSGARFLGGRRAGRRAPGWGGASQAPSGCDVIAWTRARAGLLLPRAGVAPLGCTAGAGPLHPHPRPPPPAKAAAPPTMRSRCFSASACTVNSRTLLPECRSRSTFFTHTNLQGEGSGAGAAAARV
jgi:hypothetical protein